MNRFWILQILSLHYWDDIMRYFFFIVNVLSNIDFQILKYTITSLGIFSTIFKFYVIFKYIVIYEY